MIIVNASEAVPRLAPNSVCTTGSATTTDHMPTLPSEPISTATASRPQDLRESGASSLSGNSLEVKPRCRDIGHADVEGVDAAAAAASFRTLVLEPAAFCSGA